jgi:tRNA A37 N6-isopentenylltransferase MiaA
VGYPQMGAVLRGEMTIADAAREIKRHTHRFIRHQYAWFRPRDPRIEWFDVSQDNLTPLKSRGRLLSAAKPSEGHQT